MTRRTMHLVDQPATRLDEPSVLAPNVASLLDIEPELAEGLPGRAVAIVRMRAMVSVQELATGEWDPESIARRRRTSFGFMVLSGLLAREITIAGGGALELFGAGDVVNPWGEGDGGLIAIGSSWAVVEDAQIAVIEPRTLAVLQTWPSIVSALVVRAGRRASRLAVHQAISQLPRVEQRLLALFWYLAERWGRVTSDGVTLVLPLSHGSLGHLVGARRPTVSLALKELAFQDLVGRRADGSWLLLGDPPEALASVAPSSSRHHRVRASQGHVAEVRRLPGPEISTALAERLAELRGQYERNLSATPGVLARAAAVRAATRRLVTESAQAPAPSPSSRSPRRAGSSSRR
jgi:CRP/FNR family cyclic AMP-dependent transcriptional regulator